MLHESSSRSDHRNDPVTRHGDARPAWLALVALAVALAAAFASPNVAALEFECIVPGDTRFLRVDIPGEEHLCEVSVTYQERAGERRVMWYANNETLFCSAKAYELHDKYEQQWAFDCERWPDRDGIDRLSARQRVILDVQLKTLLDEGADGRPPGLGDPETGFSNTGSPDAGSPDAGPPEADRRPAGSALNGVRAVASSPFDEDNALLALQFLRADGRHRVRVIADTDDGASVIAETPDLAARVDALPGLRLSGAFINAISPGGALEVLTLLEPEGARPGPDAPRAASCEGRQTLRADGTGALVPSTPHRHVCPPGIDPG